MKFKRLKLGKYFFDFVSVFFAVIAAFALENWNDNRKDDKAEEKILLEIKNGLELDLRDFKLNQRGHQRGLLSIAYFGDIIREVPVSQDSIMYRYFYLTGDNTLVVNTSGYESLKSKGLEIIKNDSIRSQIITIYENDYQSLDSFEESAPMYQSFQNYFLPITNILSEYLVYNNKGSLIGINTPLNLPVKEKNSLTGYLFNMRSSRRYKLELYAEIEKKINMLLLDIEKELEDR